ncbi:MAG TPA: 16S rRNA (cytosine(1402)-N(4))-methyltransferase RsmH [Nitrospiria bacterium]|nr:16S rRNA (cytosine(1402)-N(4))-methyltransferase RsmH [Nitrospiria bacterium]
MSAIHRPVMVREVVQWLACAPGRRMADLTVGLGGHASAILAACAPDGLLVGLDRDEQALAVARTRLPADRVRLHHANARALPEVVAREGWGRVDGVLLDLGVSSLQLDTPERGFSFQADGPLDMRMDRRNPLTAAVIVNEWPEDALADVIRRYGEERWAGRIAAAIARARSLHPLTGTKELAGLVVDAIPAKFRAPHPHPATRTFQALRIAVNRELEDLAPTLEAARECLTVGGRLVVISFHSLEDRIVKQTFRNWEGACVCPPGLPVCGCGRRRLARVLTPRPIAPDARETRENPRARSAKLRAVERAAA